MHQIDAGRLVLRPISRPMARMLLAGGIPRALNFAPGYPSPLSLKVMELVVDAQEPGRFGPYFMIRKADAVVIGEIECSMDGDAATGHIGYTVVESCWGHGYATEALQALLGQVLAEPGIRRAVAEAKLDNAASRRVMAKAGMRYCGQRVDIEDGKSVDVVTYEAAAGDSSGTNVVTTSRAGG